MPRNNFDDEEDDLLMALQNMEPCGNCGAEGARIPCMSGCGEVFYCSRECNMHHASAHRLRCRNLRCSKFNDSESESDSSDYEEFSDDSDAEYETDDGEEEEEEVKPKKAISKKGSLKKGKSMRKKRAESSVRDSVLESAGGKMVIDSEIERRIEEKIIRRLKKQEEHRIATAIEQRMREEKANWRDEEMNRIISQMRERFQNEMINSSFLATVAKKNGVALEGLVAGISSGHGEPAPGAAPLEGGAFASTGAEAVAMDTNTQAEEKQAVVQSDAGAMAANGEEAAAAAAAAGTGAMAASTRGRSTSKESAWNNACPAFEALRVVVWKHSFLPGIQFQANPRNGIWNSITRLDADESFSHISVGDVLISVNGRCIDETIQNEQDMNDVFAAFPSPLILKFEALDPYNGKVHDYTVTWSNGPLGVTLKDDCSNQKVPIVNRLTKKAGSVAVKQNIGIGDILVAINNIDTIQLGCSLSMSILKKVQLPAKLRFRGVGGPLPGAADAVEAEQTLEDAQENGMSNSLSMSRPSSYMIHWGEGPLGLTIIPGYSDNDLPVIKKVTGTGSSPGIEKAQIGDLLEKMNDINTVAMPFEKVVAYLKSAPKPVMLKFRSAPEEATISRPASSAALPARESSAPREMSVSREVSVTREVSVSREKSVTRDFSILTAQSSGPPMLGSQNSMESVDLARQYSTGSGSEKGTASTARAVAPPPAPVSRDVYKVVWGGGPLGLTIDAAPGGSGAYIKRIASQGAAAALSQDCIGDDMTHINDFDVTRIVFQDIVNHLKTVPRPVTLYFRRRQTPEYRATTTSSGSSSSSSQHTRMTESSATGRKPSHDTGVHYYSVVWQEGTPLGLSLRGADATCDYPYITRVTGAGSAAHLPDTVFGDCLISVDGRSVHVRDKSFDEVMSMLKSMQKPLTLKFQARGNAQLPRPASSVSLQQQDSRHAQQDPRYLQQDSHTWRQNRGGSPSDGGFESHSLPTPNDRLATSNLRQNSNLSRSFNTVGGDRPLDQATAAVANEEKYSSIQAPFLVQNKLSTGRRQKMLKGLKK
ncbi:TPA: hypothetical protein N0F65_004425 [Lagenidium giganteum]|uniref:PDZ domain-containing protein n=1 Tax=Lagenidium giganteum TaxID=4803 RepID=A0AAV2ZJK8_9STRA|nr:TPA: hypothetical protein N0F65_004425 [Lagenidium giganteum]